LVKDYEAQFALNQLVRICPYDKKGKVKNNLAQKALPYFSQVAKVLNYDLYEMGSKIVIVYFVKIEDDTILQLTEDCLIAVQG
jgi:hypothetical protein